MLLLFAGQLVSQLLSAIIASNVQLEVREVYHILETDWKVTEMW